MKPVLFVGDINVDIIMEGMESPVQTDREICCRDFHIKMGSTAVITACHFSRLGGKSSFCGLAGCDQYGDFMLKGLTSFNVDTTLVERTESVSTGVTVNLLYGRTRSQVTYPGTIEAFDGFKKVSENIDQFRHLHFSGVYLETNFIDKIAPLLELAKERAITTSLDPQWDSSEQWRYMDKWLPLLTYLFVNEDEALSITGTSCYREAWRKLKEKTANPIVKIGKEGALGEGKVYPVEDVEVVDSTGAGDTFNAAFLYSAVEKESSIEEAVKEGNREATKTCLHPGGLKERD